MDKYVKKPVVVEATPLRLWHDEEGVHGNYSEILEWIGLIAFDHPDGFVAVYKPVIDFKHSSSERAYRVSELCLIIPTLEGMMEASDGDFIIKGVQGEFYPCKADIFELTYQKVEND